MKRTASVGAILNGHRPVKYRDRNVFATLLFGIFCVVVFEMMFFVFFSSRERTSGSRRSRRELPFERTNNEVVMSSSSKSCLPSIEPNAKPCPPEVAMMRELDALVVAAKPTCANKLALMSLRQYANPRRIIVVTTERRFCEKFKTAADGIECFHEDERTLDAIPAHTTPQHQHPKLSSTFSYP